MRTIRFPIALLLLPMSCTHAAPPSPALQARAHAAALAELTARAQRAGLDDAAIAVVVPPPRRPAPGCATPFDISVGEPVRLSRIVLTAHCPSTGRTAKFIARATITATIPVASRNIAAGQPLTHDDLDSAVRTLSSLTDTVTRADDAIGKLNRRALRQGQPLSHRALQAPALIRRGQTVRIVARIGSAQVVNTGVAMQPGARGDIVRLRVGNGSAAREIQARVTGEASAEPIDLPTSDVSR
ncbi:MULTISPECIES: flagellar basal body P-ring formation chaperone FlgA [unclassified Burkholderia]|uniref:flagellar basal body P-ring formation chaperone FlgA n=1 Tax=unclassified Burkholderia TaxID=2613784 RepID=UPI00211DA2B3|nr:MULTISPECIES: flagellar basal body P-ring formation chaperone FlgA [unclassified Burkholderia]